MDPIDGNWGMEVLDTSQLIAVQVADEDPDVVPPRPVRQSDRLASRGRVNEIDLPHSAWQENDVRRALAPETAADGTSRARNDRLPA
jgi:hypothetical protein